MEDFKITKREILFSTIIICFMIGLGVWISNPILKSASESAIRTVSSVTVQDNEKFGYIKRTNAGDFLAEGWMVTMNPVRISDIDGEYMKIEKVKERYTRHVRHYTTTDGKGHTRHHTQVYWSWDVVHRDHYVASQVFFLGERFKLKNIDYSIPLNYKETQSGGFNIRYKYYVHPKTVRGVMKGVCDEKTYKNLEFVCNTTIDKEIANADHDMELYPVLFWVLWSILTIGLVIVFYYFKNNWLEDNEEGFNRYRGKDRY